MAKLSIKQKQARVLAMNNGGVVTTDQITGATGASLEKRGLVNRFFQSGGYGLICSYKLTESGRQVIESEIDYD